MTKKQQQTGSFWIWDWEFVKPCSEQLKIPKELTQDVNDPKKVVLLHDFGLLPTPYYRAVGTDWPSPNPHDLGRSGSIILSGDGEFMTTPVLFVPPPPRIFWYSYGPVTKSRSSSHANSPWYALTCNICEFGGSDVSNFDLMAQNIPLCRPNITHGLPIITALFGNNYPLSTYVNFKILYISVSNAWHV